MKPSYKQRVVALDEETYLSLQSIASKEFRSSVGQIRFWVNREKTNKQGTHCTLCMQLNVRHTAGAAVGYRFSCCT